MRFSSLSSVAASCAVVFLFACGGSDDATSSDDASGTAGASGGNAAGSSGKAGGAGTSGAAGKASAGTGGTSTGGAAGTASSGAAGQAGAAAGTGGSAAGSAGTGGASAGAAGKASSGAAGAAGQPTAGSGGASGSAGMSTGGSAGAASDAKCTNAMPCTAPTEFCNYSDNLCGASMYVGHCKSRPSGCSSVFTPVCGCDGTVYSNSCSASAAGFDLANEGTCAPPDPKLFACGPYFCDKATQYCEKIGDLPSIADSYECKSLPPICAGTASCDCLDKTICGMFECVDTVDGGHKTICPGP